MSGSGARSTERTLYATLILTLLLSGLASPTAATDTGSDPLQSGTIVQLSGDIQLETSLSYGPGVQVRILPGTTVRPVPGTPPNATPNITVQGSLQALGTTVDPVALHVPLLVRSSPSQVTRIENATFLTPHRDPCNVLLATGRAHLDSITIRGGDTGLCVQPPTGTGLPVHPRPPDGHRVPGPTDHEGRQDTNLLPVPPGSADRRGSLRGAPPDSSPTLAPADPRPPGVVDIRSLEVEDSKVGIALADDSPLVELSHSTVRSNEVGLHSAGGKARLDHVTLEDNRLWDLHAMYVGDVQWRYSSFDVACSNIEGRESHGCERGSISQTPLLFVLSLVSLGVEAVRASLVRLAIWLRLYSRIPTSQLLDDETRAELTKLIAAAPGMSQRQLAREIGSYGKTVHHLRKLERAEFICSRMDGQYRRYYLPGQADDPTAPTRERVLSTVHQAPGLHQRAVARRLGIARQLVGYHVRNLLKEGLLEAEERERKVCLWPAKDASKGSAAPRAADRKRTSASPVLMENV